MEDLRDVGEKAIESVNKLGASDAGDLVLGIGEIIQELRDKPDLYADKLDHLEGLFREFVYGEGYELRNNRVPEKEEEDDDPFGLGGFGGGIMASGLMTFAPLSGTLPTSAISGYTGPGLGSPIKKSQEELDKEQEEYEKDRKEAQEIFEEFSRPLQEALRPPTMVPVLEGVPKKKKKKEFKKRWWNKQT